MHAAQQLTENGILIVSLKTVDSGCNQMLEAFAASVVVLSRAINVIPS